MGPGSNRGGDTSDLRLSVVLILCVVVRHYTCELASSIFRLLCVPDCIAFFRSFGPCIMFGDMGFVVFFFVTMG